jgi:hypothetical protein
MSGGGRGLLRLHRGCESERRGERRCREGLVETHPHFQASGLIVEMPLEGGRS